MSQSSDAFPFEEVNTNNGTVYSFKHLLGKSRPLLKAKEIAEVAARSEHPVLIHGETGVGKEVFAQSIHNGSSRAAKPFVAVNCAALPESLLESTLFGTVRGAFTGALDKQGLFEEAQGGTLFLDELNSKMCIRDSHCLIPTARSVTTVALNKRSAIIARPVKNRMTAGISRFMVNPPFNCPTS